MLSKGNKRKRSKRHGFLVRARRSMNVLKSRRNKGRRRLSA